MIDVISFRVDHFYQLNNLRFRDQITPEVLKRLAKNPYSRTFVTRHGEVVMCAGLIPHWKGRAECWAIPNTGFTSEFLGVHRWAKTLLDAVPFTRIEASVEQGFEPGHRWARLLGFKRESDVMRHYFPDGANAYLYARVK